MDLLTVLCLITIIFFLILIHYRFHSIFRSKHRHASNDYVLELHSSTKCQCKYCQGTYKPIKRLGYGGYGISYLCKNIYTDVLFVLKSIPVQSINDANEALNEVYFLQRLHHPNVVHYEEVFESFSFIIFSSFCTTTIANIRAISSRSLLSWSIARKAIYIPLSPPLLIHAPILTINCFTSLFNCVMP